MLVCGLRYLIQREQRLLKRCQAAEEALKQQQDLLKKEQILDREEEKVNKLVNEALVCYQQRTRLKRGRTKERSRHSSGEELATAAKVKSPKSKERDMSASPAFVEEPKAKKQQTQPNSSVSEEIGVSSSITEEISEEHISKASLSKPLSAQSVHTTISRGLSDYGLDTFESFHSTTLSRQDLPPHPITTSTPSHESMQKPSQANDDPSISITGEWSSSCWVSLKKKLGGGAEGEQW